MADALFTAARLSRRRRCLRHAAAGRETRLPLKLRPARRT